MSSVQASVAALSPATIRIEGYYFGHSTLILSVDRGGVDKAILLLVGVEYIDLMEETRCDELSITDLRDCGSIDSRTVSVLSDESESQHLVALTIRSGTSTSHAVASHIDVTSLAAYRLSEWPRLIHDAVKRTGA